MRTSIALILAAVVAMSTTGCTHHSWRNILHRGADCGPTAPTTLPLVGGMTSYTPGCGIEGVTGGQPLIYEGGYPVDGTVVMPEPVQ